MDVVRAAGAEVYAEEERTFDFGEEDAENNDMNIHPSLLKDYGGEDFSKYLSDGDDGVEMEDIYRRRPEREPIQQYINACDEGNLYDTIQDVVHDSYSQTQGVPACQMRQADDHPGHHNRSSRLSRLLKDQLSKATNTIRPRSKKQTTQEQASYSTPCDNNPNKIYNFSFADSKMGYSLAALITEQQTPRDPVENADSGIGTESNSDIPDVLDELPGLKRSSWWSLGTLSSRLATGPNATPPSDPSLGKGYSSSMSVLNGDPETGAARTNRNSINLGKMWQKVASTISKKNQPKTELTIQTGEIRL